MPTPRRPEIRKRSDKAEIGGAYSTITRAEVKAEDHIRAKASPIPIARIPIIPPMKKGRRLRATLSYPFVGRKPAKA